MTKSRKLLEKFRIYVKKPQFNYWMEESGFFVYCEIHLFLAKMISQPPNL
jgi:hypothetical protein